MSVVQQSFRISYAVFNEIMIVYCVVCQCQFYGKIISFRTEYGKMSIYPSLEDMKVDQMMQVSD